MAEQGSLLSCATLRVLLDDMDRGGELRQYCDRDEASGKACIALIAFKFLGLVCIDICDDEQKRPRLRVNSGVWCNKRSRC
jgi:hypothetical protein